MSTFEPAKRLANFHLVAQPADLRLNPPESYLYVQYGFIFACGVIYALCYAFYIMRTIKDKTVAGGIEYLGLAEAYELYYALVTTTTKFERWSFSIWFMLDITFATVAIMTYPPKRRRNVLASMVLLLVAGLVTLQVLMQTYPDEREQVTAYWTGLAIQLPVEWESVYLMLSRGNTKGHSLEI